MNNVDKNWLLRGTVVLVSPDCLADGLHMQNRVGVISETNLDFDNIYVDFYFGVGIYSADSLFTFLPKETILKNLSELPAGITTDSFKALIRINPYLYDGNVTSSIKAMRIVSEHPAIRGLFTETLDNKISRDIQYTPFTTINLI